MKKSLLLILGLLAAGDAMAIVGGVTCASGYVYDTTSKTCVVGGCVEYTDKTIECPSGTVKCCAYDTSCSSTGDILMCKCVKATQCTEDYICGVLPYNWTATTNTTDDCTKYYKACRFINVNPAYNSMLLNTWYAMVIKEEQYSCSQGCYMQDGYCSKCPGDGISSSYNKGDITSCYLPANTEFTDEHGNKYYFDADCAHTASE